MNGFSGLMVGHAHMSRFVILVASVFQISCGKQTGRQTNEPSNQ